MDILQFAEKYLGIFKNGTNELKVKKCPFCGKEKEKFYVNINTGSYFCHSGSCNAKGNFERLKEKFGVETAIKFKEKKEIKKSIKELNKDDYELNNSKMINYLQGRGISQETVKENKILWNIKSNAMTFFLTEGYENLETDEQYPKLRTVGIKYRTIDKKVWAETGSKLVLLGLDLFPKEENTVYITEGEIDFLTLKELGYKNCVSVPSGTSNFDWVEYNKYFLENREIILCYDNDDAGRKAEEKAIKKLQGIAKNIKVINLNYDGDINDVLMNCGVTTLINILENPIKKEVEGIKNIKEIGRFNINDIQRFRTGISSLDTSLRGFKETELIVLAGENGSGKTTVLTQTMLQAINQGEKVFLYNGELGEEMWKEWLFLQASGGNGIEKRKDNLTGNVDYFVGNETYSKIDSWLDNKLFVNTSKKSSDPKDLLIRMKDACLTKNCFLFVIDNLSTLNFIGDKPSHELLGEFVSEIKEFAKEFNVCVVVINHLIKSEGKPTKDKIKGSGKITDVADTVLLVEKGKIHVTKNRFYGVMLEIDTGFDSRTKRVFDSSNASIEKDFKYDYELEEDFEFTNFSDFCDNWSK